MKSPLERRSFSRPQRLELIESRGANGSELSILEGSPVGAAAGGAGGSSLATPAPNRGHLGSLPRAPNSEQRKPRVGKDKGKGDQVKTKSPRRKELPASQATTGPKAALPQGKRQETHPESQGRPMLEAVQVFHALGKKQDWAIAYRTPQGIAETQEHPAAPAGALQPAPEVLRLPPVPSPLMEVDLPKGLGARKVSVAQVDRGMPGQGRICLDKMLAPCGAEAEEEGAGPRKKRKKEPPEPSPEARGKRRSSLSNHRLESGKKKHELSGQSHIQDRQPAPEISERLAAPAGASAMARVALQEEAAPLSHKRKRGHPEPTPEVWKKLRTFLSANMPAAPKHKDRRAGSFRVPRPPPEVQEREGTPAEDAEREFLKWKAQRERELAALGPRNFFEERQRDMEISRYYGYAV